MAPSSWQRARGIGLPVAIVIFVAVAPPAPGAEPMQASTSFAAASDGISVAFEAHGAGSPALVFVHGWSCDRTYWNAQLGPFSSEFQVVAMDVGGHGESGLERKSWTMASFGDDVAAVVEKLDLQRVILIGHSMGGDVIVEAARRLPDRVVGLVWVDAYKRLGMTRTPEQIEEMLAPLRGDFRAAVRERVTGLFPPGADEGLVERVADDMSSAPPEVAVEALASALKYGGEVTDALEELELPVFAINAADPPTDLQSMERYGVQVVLMDGVGHFLMMEDPERFNPLLREVITRLL